MSVRLRAFICGWFNQPESFFLAGGADTLLRAPIPAYLIEHPKGLALFDTGLSPAMRELWGQGPVLEFGAGSDIAARLIAEGIDPASIRWVINSHFHLDHCGGNALLPNATIIIQRTELDFAKAESGSALYDASLFDLGQAILAIHGEHDVFGDGSTVVFPTIGHTPGHQSLRLRLETGQVVLAADCCYLKRSLDELRLSPADIDKDQALSTLRRLSALRDEGVRIFYGHDGDFWRRIPQGARLS